MRRGLLPILPVVGLVLALAACSGDDDGTGPGGGQTVTVSMKDFSFSPQVDTVKVGDTVQWRNDGSVPHNTTSNTGLWESTNLQPGQTYSHKFDQAGSFPYECTLHQGMTGTIVVE